MLNGIEGVTKTIAHFHSVLKKYLAAITVIFRNYKVLKIVVQHQLQTFT